VIHPGGGIDCGIATGHRQSPVSGKFKMSLPTTSSRFFAPPRDRSWCILGYPAADIDSGEARPCQPRHKAVMNVVAAGSVGITAEVTLGRRARLVFPPAQVRTQLPNTVIRSHNGAG
jgi:hypothetical protein